MSVELTTAYGIIRAEIAVAAFLFAVWPFTGHIHPTLAIAANLQRRGHAVAFYTGARAAPLVGASAIPCFPMAAECEAVIDAVWLTPARAMRRRNPLQLIRGMRHWLVDTLPFQARDLEQLLTAHHFDALIADATMWAPFVLLSKAVVPHVIACSTASGCFMPGPDAPPWGAGLPPPRTRRARLASQAAAAVVSLLATRLRRRVAGQRARHGLPPIEGAVSEHIGRHFPNLVRGSPEFDYERRDLPPNIHYVGPLLLGARADEQLPPWAQGRDRRRPLVHIAETSLPHRGMLSMLAVRALISSGFDVSIAVGARGEGGPLDSAEPHLHVDQWLPHSLLLPICDVVVCGGGAGTVFGALAAGVPVVVVPSESDQYETAQRVVASGAGISVPQTRCSPSRLLDAVQRVYSNGSFRANTRRLAAAFKSYGGASRAADVIEAVSLSTKTTAGTGP